MMQGDDDEEEYWKEKFMIWGTQGLRSVRGGGEGGVGGGGVEGGGGGE